MKNNLNLTAENIYVNNINISDKNYKFNLIKKYKYIPGIIFIYNNSNNNDCNNKCFTGGETSNIYKNKNGKINNHWKIIRNKYDREIIGTIYFIINNSKFWKLIF